jgi:hypothetical protein
VIAQQDVEKILDGLRIPLPAFDKVRALLLSLQGLAYPFLIMGFILSYRLEQPQEQRACLHCHVTPVLHSLTAQRQPERGEGVSIEERSEEQARLSIGVWQEETPQRRADDFRQREVLAASSLQGE